MENVTNQLSLCGEIMEAPQFDHEVFGEAFFHTLLNVPRLSGAFDLLPLTISERLMAEPFRQGATVAISGQLRSYNKVLGGAGRLLLTAFAQHLRPVDSAENPNTVFLTGALCKPPSFRTTPFGREIADLMVAVNRSYGKSDYIPCIAWGRTARFAAGLGVGDRIQLQGRFQSRVYQKQLPDGAVQERTAYEVSVSRLTLESGGAPALREAASRPGYTGVVN
ncbi:MAG: single-stranded DNA-binding protein [Clostridia bacterium]|nr:single-stranded DNA-binding protein [Clostridia bacterium]